ncbi:ABC transporter substrate-binding protein [Streptomyces sp. N2-109]|uniref:ABC transporter substrate-binding protein n=1 Tax=Streptomyces gossypii TaxID=2883101 RepID=A0ABT2JWP4_9ACTN|nr:ABC transporter substrate-binding protein [Streptomyces gossypii]MCT2592098.1 ABC transporter substrate-binding protein [Streptomyces gossypii]
MIERLRKLLLLPVNKLFAGFVCLAVVGGLFYFLDPQLPGDDEKCGKGLEELDGECIGVTEEAFVFDEEIESLVEAVAEENARVRDGWEDPSGGAPRIPYVRVALMMPFTEDDTSAMTMKQIKHGLAGAHAAQLRANEESGLRYQLVLANNGKDLDQWKPVVEQLAGMTGGDTPLVAVMGHPSSTPATQEAADALSARKIPSLGPVLTSPDMSSDYLFKTSASNEHFALALEQYLVQQPGSGEGFLVWDQRKQDNYAENLRQVFMDQFGAEYDLRKRNGSYVGVTGDDAGIPQRFVPVAQKICLTGADTVFFAGRDRDLPPLVTQLAQQASCEHKQEMRIVKVGIGRDPVFTTEETTDKMRKAKITTVTAADVDPRWWEDGKQQPAGYEAFDKVFRGLEREHQLGGPARDDGYAIMYHDAFAVIAQAADESYTAANDTDGQKPAPGDDGKGGDGKGDSDTDKAELRVPTKDDVYNTISNMSVLGTEDGSDCVNCVRGASGTFGFDGDPETDKWPVCRPVPIVEYPERQSGEGEGGGNGEGGSKGKDEQPYRTHEDIFGGECF